MSVNTGVTEVTKNQTFIYKKKTVFVLYISLFYRIRDVRKERLRIEESRSQGGRSYERLLRSSGCLLDCYDSTLRRVNARGQFPVDFRNCGMMRVARLPCMC